MAPSATLADEIADFKGSARSSSTPASSSSFCDHRRPARPRARSCRRGRAGRPRRRASPASRITGRSRPGTVDQGGSRRVGAHAESGDDLEAAVGFARDHARRGAGVGGHVEGVRGDPFGDLQANAREGEGVDLELGAPGPPPCSSVRHRSLSVRSSTLPCRANTRRGFEAALSQPFDFSSPDSLRRQGLAGTRWPAGDRRGCSAPPDASSERRSRVESSREQRTATPSASAAPSSPMIRLTCRYFPTPRSRAVNRQRG